MLIWILNHSFYTVHMRCTTLEENVTVIFCYLGSWGVRIFKTRSSRL